MAVTRFRVHATPIMTDSDQAVGLTKMISVTTARFDDIRNVLDEQAGRPPNPLGNDRPRPSARAMRCARPSTVTTWRGLTGMGLGIPPAFVDRPRLGPVPHLDPFTRAASTNGDADSNPRPVTTTGVALVEHLDRDRRGQDSGG